MPTKLSKYFTREELACPDTGDCLINAKLLVKLDELRELAGKPIIVTSGYRSPTHNAKVGGAQSSQHTEGKAADLVCLGLSYKKFLKLCEQVFANGGVGCYPEEKFVHVDVRAKKARWARVNGVYVGFEEGKKVIV